MNDFFNTLGIEATKEEKEIKKAYRDKLHTVNPEDPDQKHRFRTGSASPHMLHPDRKSVV